MIYITSSSSDKKTGGTGFPKPVALVSAPVRLKPVALDLPNRWHRFSACGAQLGAQRLERKKGGLGKVEGDAVMLTPCLVCTAKAGEWRSTREANLQAATLVRKWFRPWNGSNELGDGWRTRRGRFGWEESTHGDRRRPDGDGAAQP